MKTAFITGGLGFIGSFITRQLLDEKRVDKVVIMDHYGGYIDPTKQGYVDYRQQRLYGYEQSIVIERGEPHYYSVLEKLLKQYQPAYIFHLAALPLAKLDNLNAQEAMEGSVESTTNFFEIISGIDGYQPERFIYASSSMVYGDFLSETATEDHPTNPREIYGTMKLAGEIVTRGLGSFYQIPYTIIRPSAVYGPTDMNRRVSQIFLEKALHGEVLRIMGPEEKLDFTYVKDVANGFILAAMDEHGANETFNITFGQAHSLMDYVNCLRKHFPNIKTEVKERDSFRPRRGTLSVAKAKRCIGYQPNYSLEKGIAEYVSYVLNR